MDYLQTWENHVETKRRMSSCKRVIELFGKRNIFRELEEEYLDLDNEVNCILKLTACDYDNYCAVCDNIEEVEIYERQNERMYDIFKAYCKIAKGKIDTDTMAYSKMFNLQECENWCCKAYITYKNICNKIKSTKLLMACIVNSNDENRNYSKPIERYAKQGLSIEKIAANLCINQDIVESYILELLKNGKLVYDLFAVEYVTERDVLNAIDLIGDDDKLGSIKELLDDSISYFDIKVVLAKNKLI